MRTTVGLFLLGGIAGAGIAWLVWLYASKKLDEQLSAGGSELSTGIATGRSELVARLNAGEIQMQQQIRAAVAREVPPTVRSTLDAKLREYNITPETGRRLSALLTVGEGAGLL